MYNNNRFLFITVLTILLSMGILSVFGQGFDFASKVKSSIANVQKEADKDPDTFKENIAKLEKEWNGRKGSCGTECGACDVGFCLQRNEVDTHY